MMRRVLKWVVIVVLALGGWFGYREYRKPVVEFLNVAMWTEEISEDKSFLLVVIDDGCGRHEKCLDSLIAQDYDQYQVLYLINGDGKRIVEYGAAKKMGDRLTVMEKPEEKNFLSFLYEQIYPISNDTIVVLIEGRDWLFQKHVLSDLNHNYQNDDIWMTYGQFVEAKTLLPELFGIHSHPWYRSVYLKREMRELLAEYWDFPRKREDMAYVFGAETFGPLRTFYAGLMKHLRKEELSAREDYNPVKDLSLVLPLVEMCKEHTYYTNSLSYVYDQNKEYGTNERDKTDFLMTCSPYSKLGTPPYKKQDS